MKKYIVLMLCLCFLGTVNASTTINVESNDKNEAELTNTITVNAGSCSLCESVCKSLAKKSQTNDTITYSCTNNGNPNDQKKIKPNGTVDITAKFSQTEDSNSETITGTDQDGATVTCICTYTQPAS